MMPSTDDPAGFRKPTEAEIKLAESLRRRQSTTSPEVDEIWANLPITPYYRKLNPFARADRGVTFEPNPDRSITYRLDGDVLVRGDGRSMDFVGSPSPERLRTALAIAAKTYGSPLMLTGPPAFTARALSVAVDLGIAVANPELQLIQEHMRAARGLEPTATSPMPAAEDEVAPEVDRGDARGVERDRVASTPATAPAAADQPLIVSREPAGPGDRENAALARELIAAINERPSWDTVHETLEAHGLIYAEFFGHNDKGQYRGGGLWTPDQEWYARPSDIDGALGIGALEKVLGKFTGESIDLGDTRTPPPAQTKPTPGQPPDRLPAAEAGTLVRKDPRFDPAEALLPAPGSTVSGELVAYGEIAAYLATAEGHTVEVPLAAALGMELGDAVTAEIGPKTRVARQSPQAANTSEPALGGRRRR
jgi:hypothetical protein